MFSISKQDALKIVQAMRMLKLLDEQFFNDIDGAERLMNDLTLFVIGEEGQLPHPIEGGACKSSS